MDSSVGDVGCLVIRYERPLTFTRNKNDDVGHLFDDTSCEDISREYFDSATWLVNLTFPVNVAMATRGTGPVYFRGKGRSDR